MSADTKFLTLVLAAEGRRIEVFGGEKGSSNPPEERTSVGGRPLELSSLQAVLHGRSSVCFRPG